MVFFGDSITDRCDLKTYYPDIYALNRGISGNTCSDLYHRLDVSVCEARPSKIVLLAGINDMMNLERSAEETARRYEILLRALREKCPDVPLICQSVYPGYDAEKNKKNRGLIFPIKALTPDIIRLNERIRELCGTYGAVYVDVFSRLQRSDGTMDPAYSDDGCHPNDAGYRIAAEVLRGCLG